MQIQKTVSFSFVQFLTEVLASYSQEYMVREKQHELRETIGYRALVISARYPGVVQKFKREISLESFLLVAQTFGSHLLWRVDCQMGDRQLVERWKRLDEIEQGKLLVEEITKEFQELFKSLN